METRTSNPVRMDREDEKKMLPCRFFIGGYCHKANRCRFYHPQPGGLSSIMIVPPLPHHFSTPPVVSPNTPRNNHFLSSTPSSIRSGNLGSTRRGSRSENVIQTAESVDYGYSPPSPTYSEYNVDYQNQKYEPEEEQAQPPQNTVFNHIDWTQFLAPGCLPPPPIQIGSEEANKHIIVPPVASTDVEVLSNVVPFMNYRMRQKLTENIENEDTPPEGRQSLEVNIHEDNLSPTDRVKLSAKLELQMKVQQIAKELADEPAKHVRNLDSFFRTYNFKALPLSNVSLMDENMNETEIIEATIAENEKNENERKDASDLSLATTNIESNESKENIPTEVK